MVGRLGRAFDDLRGPQPMAAWAEALLAATEALAVAPPTDAWQREQLRRLLADAADEGTTRPDAGPALRLDEARAMLDGRLQGRPTRANFRTGDLTICTL
ncbi:MAG TPA: hypothetical protein VKV25_00415, partial [Acidimicrobiales bacterium]|nr:hypothetical protein [Acidimicrobiales bacterium]